MVRLRFSFLMMAAAGALLGSCAPAPKQSGNQMMLVRESPGSLGYRKLMARSEEFGDLKVFISEKGLPDFVAEANSDDRNYLIFYYLDKHQAFACRTRSANGGSIEFAGPYPMTQGEWKLLTTVKKDSEKKASVN